MNLVFFFVGFTLIVVMLVVLTVIVLAFRYFKELPPDRAVVITGMTGRRTAKLVGALIVPKLDRADYVDISPKTLVLDRDLVTKEGPGITTHAEVEIRVRPTPLGVLLAADSVGAATTFDEPAINERFRTTVEEALDALAKERSSEELFAPEQPWRKRLEELAELGDQGYMFGSISLSRL